MFSFGYRDRRWRIFKDICFVAVAVVLILRTGFWGVIIGMMALLWYGWDLYGLLRAVRLEKEAEKAQSQPRAQAQPKSGDSSQADDTKITVTNLSDAKEVNYEKE